MRRGLYVADGAAQCGFPPIGRDQSTSESCCYLNFIDGLVVSVLDCRIAGLASQRHFRHLATTERMRVLTPKYGSK